MDALKIVPQVFFDAIARMIPGMVALYMLALFEPDAWGNLARALTRMFGDRGVDAPALALLAATYAVGHMVSPATKMIQRLTELYPRVAPKTESDDRQTS